MKEVMLLVLGVVVFVLAAFAGALIGDFIRMIAPPKKESQGLCFQKDGNGTPREIRRK